MLRRVKMCTVQCQFDVMCASIVLEPRKMRTTTLHHTTPSVGMVFHGPLYVSIFPFHNPRLVSKFNQSTIAQPFEKKKQKNRTSKKIHPLHITTNSQSPTFFIWKFEKNPGLHGSSSNSVIFCGGAGGAMVRKNCAWRNRVRRLQVMSFLRLVNGRHMIITWDILYIIIFFMFIIHQYCLSTRELFDREKWNDWV